MKPVSREKRRELTVLLTESLRSGDLTLQDASRAMRKIAGLTQKEYAEKICGINARVLIDFERGIGNPTLKTLEAIAKPFNLKITFFPK